MKYKYPASLNLPLLVIIQGTMSDLLNSQEYLCIFNYINLYYITNLQYYCIETMHILSEDYLLEKQDIV